MALFSRTKKTETKSDVAPMVVSMADVAHVLQSPRITEKATMVTSNSIYVFDIDDAANKKQVMAAVEKVYKVKPQKVAIVNTKPKRVRNARTGTYGIKPGGKKAYVYLKKGESITIA